MSEAHPLDPNGAAVFGCAQAGCRACQEALLVRHEGLVYFLLVRQARGGVADNDLLQEGRIALWDAILHFDPYRGSTFGAYAAVAIKRRIWRAVRLGTRPQGRLPPVDPLLALEESWERAAIHAALLEAVARLPDRLRAVMVGTYGLDGQPRQTMTVIAHQMELTPQRVQQMRNEALILLRLPTYSAKLRYLCGQDSRAAYARSEALSRAWLECRRRTRQRYERKQR